MIYIPADVTEKYKVFFLTCYGKPFYGFPNILGIFPENSVKS